MSNVPKYLAEARLLFYSKFQRIRIDLSSKHNIAYFMLICRKGSRLGHDSLVDGMLKDGLWDVYSNSGMGTCAELCAEKYQITREAQVLIIVDFEFDSLFIIM